MEKNEGRCGERRPSDEHGRGGEEMHTRAAGPRERTSASRTTPDLHGSTGTSPAPAPARAQWGAPGYSAQPASTERACCGALTPVCPDTLPRTLGSAGLPELFTRPAHRAPGAAVRIAPPSAD